MIDIFNLAQLVTKKLIKLDFQKEKLEKRLKIEKTPFIQS